MTFNERWRMRDYSDIEIYKSPVSAQDAYNQGLVDLQNALKDKNYLKANFNTKNWLDIIRDFPASQIVNDYKDYLNKDSEETDDGIKIGDVVIVKDAVNRPFEGVVTQIDTDLI